MSVSQLDVRQVNMPGADVCLIKNVFRNPEAVFQDLMQNTPWQQESIRLFGRDQVMPRLTCWMGSVAYTYSGLENLPRKMCPAVGMICREVEKLSGHSFNGVLLNLYRDGRDSMGWHADDEASLGNEPIIASVNLGAQRRMKFKPKPHHSADKTDIELSDNSVLLMRGATQENWLHAVPKTAKPVGPRINLTFRKITSD